MIRARIGLRGVVQGVGFRPFVFRLARDLALPGQVANTTAGVDIEVHGSRDVVESFIERLTTECPPLARVDNLTVDRTPPLPTDARPDRFSIQPSKTALERSGVVPPDSDVCPDCLAELRNPDNRRCDYPFITCTNCGPRYTLIAAMPYDRPQTAMQPFTMCARCLAEYQDPIDRRFHAQTNCCKTCGPHLLLTDPTGRVLSRNNEAMARTIELLGQGRILAIKGVGGFLLAVNGVDDAAIGRLRQRKMRPDKPLAVMAANIAAVRAFARLSPEEIEWLESRQKPIVLLRKQHSFPLAANLAPDNGRIGVMLPYTPLHHLLFRHNDYPALVMTSGNLSGAPIIRDNDEALTRLGPMVDALLLHDRDILVRTDDSVLMADESGPVLIRRARAFVPVPLHLRHDCGHTLALGSMLKNTICVTRGDEAWLSQHLGDLDTLETAEYQERAIARLLDLLGITPDLLVHDLHPHSPGSKYAATRYPGCPVLAVQHHHAHVAACMAEHQLNGPVIGVALDGTGYGPDHTIWGGEVLIASLRDYRRAAHLSQMPLPGNEAAIRHPWRMTVSALYHAFGPDGMELELDVLHAHQAEIAVLLQMMRQNINTVLTSSCGRLFDAVAALLGCCFSVSHEGQAAMALEAMAGQAANGHDAPVYPYTIQDHGDQPMILDSRPMIRAIVADRLRNRNRAMISQGFHQTLARLFADTCQRLRQAHGINQVVLSGGVLQNMILLGQLTEMLRQQDFAVYSHHQVPPNDGGLALGQALVGRARHEGRDTPPLP